MNTLGREAPQLNDVQVVAFLILFHYVHFIIPVSRLLFYLQFLIVFASLLLRSGDAGLDYDPVVTIAKKLRQCSHSLWKSFKFHRYFHDIKCKGDAPTLSQLQKTAITWYKRLLSFVGTNLQSHHM